MLFFLFRKGAEKRRGIGGNGIKMDMYMCVKFFHVVGKKKTPLTQEVVLNFTFLSKIYENVDCRSWSCEELHLGFAEIAKTIGCFKCSSLAMAPHSDPHCE